MIQKEYQSILKDVVSVFSAEFATALDSLYVYGSVAKGNAVIAQSDLDICVVFKHDIQSLDLKIAEIKRSLIVRYPYIPKIDVDIGYLKEVLDEKNKKRWGAWLKFFCTNIYGRDLTHFFQEITIDREVIRAINQGYGEEIQTYFELLEIKDKPQAELLNLKTSLIKRMIRLLPLTMRHIEEWPLALNDTIDQTVQVYPQQKDQLYFLLQELDKPTLTNVISLNRLRETYVWIEAHLL
ncbi:nucleotidyltransferase domain-containing protein [Acinetobacter courvalinii]|uniref:Nucleotidyltransferase domain-containing protein n=1 Tax=Acinetobacter courvalinii TaxID=280147 RepID=A0AA42LDF1_9GAMM|nr:nucleotidyltransferase domain-containing protein [Acinetobacter courvalinii]MDH0562312.1 nucleotidyltransferase domain-containing protein [Acinetobacter courvalinii]